MCGVIGIVAQGSESVVPQLLRGLEVLEPRGYDSTGLAVLNGSIHLRKREGKLANLVASLDSSIVGSAGIAHTRWATHGKPTDSNAHPHVSMDGSVAVAHNGIIENYRQLRAMLSQEGVAFKSETDTEVIPNLIARELRRGEKNLSVALRNVIPLLKGEFAILALSKSHPNEMVAATCERPLILGRGPAGLSIASLEVALVGQADSVTEVDNGEVIAIGPNGTVTAFRTSKRGWRSLQKTFRPITASEEQMSKGDFGTFMEKEIYEQPVAVTRALMGRLVDDDVVLPELSPVAVKMLKRVPYVTAAACGTSYYALLAAKLLFDKIAGLPLIVEHASEFQDRNPSMNAKSLFLAVSQSGETADTVGALEYAHKRGAHTIALTNAKGSQLVRMAHCDISVQAGPERAVASTKAYTAQVTALTLLALHAGTIRGTLTSERRIALIKSLRDLPAQITQVLKLAPKVKKIARKYKHAERLVIIGKGFAVPLAYEGALKIQEIAYLDSYGFPSGELKHGPLALVTHGVPVVAIALNGTASHRTLSNAEEVISRGGEIIAIVSKGSVEEEHFRSRDVQVISLPSAQEEMTPILGAMIVQLLALYLGIARGNDVDRPRNLAKSVTVR